MSLSTNLWIHSQALRLENNSYAHSQSILYPYYEGQSNALLNQHGWHINNYMQNYPRDVFFY